MIKKSIFFNLNFHSLLGLIFLSISVEAQTNNINKDDDLVKYKLTHLLNKYNQIDFFNNGISRVKINKDKSYSDSIDGKHYKDITLEYNDLYSFLTDEIENSSYVSYGKIDSFNKLLIDYFNYLPIGDSIYKKIVDTNFRLLNTNYKGRILTLKEFEKDKFKVISVQDSIPFLYGYIDTLGNEIIPVNNYFIYQDFEKNIIIFDRYNGFKGIYDLKGKLLFEEEYIELEGLNYNNGIVKYDKIINKVKVNEDGYIFDRLEYKTIELDLKKIH